MEQLILIPIGIHYHRSTKARLWSVHILQDPISGLGAPKIDSSTLIEEEFPTYKIEENAQNKKTNELPSHRKYYYLHTTYIVIIVN